MSCTTLYAVMPDNDGEFTEAGEYRNSYGSAVFIWHALLDTYKRGILNGRPLMGDPGVGWDPSAVDRFSAYDLLWKYDSKGGELQPWERNALKSTYDNALLPRAGMLTMADSLERFAAAHHTGKRLHGVCSLREQAATLREIHAKGALAAAWNQTSCSEFWGDGTYEDDEDETSTPYSIDRDDKHWEIAVLPLDGEQS